MARLVAQSGHAFEIPLQGVSFGSDSANHVVIPAEYGVAPSHFAIWPYEGGFFVRDSGSGYGLWINGQAASQAMLSDGDYISAGQLQLKYEDPLSVSTPPPGLFGGMVQQPVRAASAVRPTRYSFESSVASSRPAGVLPVSEPTVSRMSAFSASAHAAATVERRAQNFAPAISAPPEIVEAERPEPAFRPAAAPAPTPEPASEPVQTPLNRASQPKFMDATFEILPEEETGPPKSDAAEPNFTNVVAQDRARQQDPGDAYAKGVAPSWLPQTAVEEPLYGPPKKFVPAPVEKIKGAWLRSVITFSLLAAALAGVSTSRYWGKPLADKLENVLTAVFTNESVYDRPAPALAETQYGAEALRTRAEDIHVDATKSHTEVVRRFVWEDATTLFSLTFPQIEIFYLNEAQHHGLPLPKRYCTYLEKNFGLKISDLERLTSVQVDSEKTGIVIISTQKKMNAADWVGNSDVKEQTTETVAGQQILRFTTANGVDCGLVAVDERNFALGDPATLKACLQRPADASSAALAALWPDFLQKQPAAFLWTVKLDAALKKQLGELGGSSPSQQDLAAVQSFAVQFGGEPPRSDCYALRDPGASQEQFASAASACLKSMVGMLSSNSENSFNRRNAVRDMPSVEVSRSAASVEVKGGQDFVNIFLQGFYAPMVADEGPLHSLALARTLAHSFNLAKSMNAPESRRVHTVDEALEALQKGMSGSGRAAAMEFQVQEMDAEEQRQIRKYLTFADGYLACRPDLDALPEMMRSLAEEARDRINAETVLSLVRPPPGDKAIIVPDLGAYIRRELTTLKNKSGPMALFGMPQLTEAEMSGVLSYICQQPNGKLAWKPGEVSYNAWQAKSNPKAIHDATTLASLSGAARAAGAQSLTKAQSVEEAVKLLSKGVSGTGQFNATQFRCQNMTESDLRAAASLLELDSGLLRLKREMDER